VERRRTLLEDRREVALLALQPGVEAGERRGCVIEDVLQLMLSRRQRTEEDVAVLDETAQVAVLAGELGGDGVELPVEAIELGAALGEHRGERREVAAQRVEVAQR